MHWIGIDVGGTFTDAVAYDDATGEMTFAKAPSTPSDPTQGVLDVLAKLKVDLIKIWVDDLHGKSPKIKPAVVEAILDQAGVAQRRVLRIGQPSRQHRLAHLSQRALLRPQHGGRRLV